MRWAVCFVTAIVLAMSAAPLAGQQVRGRVVDEPSRQAVQGASVMLLDTLGAIIAGTSTAADGFFKLSAPRAGTYVIAVQQPGYAEDRRSITLGTMDLTVPAFVLRTEAIPLDSIAVEQRSNRGEPSPAGFQRASHVIAGARMAQLEAHGRRLVTIVAEIGSLRVRQWSDRGRPRVCVGSVRSLPSMRGGSTECEWVAIVIDGVTLGGDLEGTFRSLHVANFESIEYVPPADAALLYGMNAGTSGALVFWSRGRGPHADPNRNR